MNSSKKLEFQKLLDYHITKLKQLLVIDTHDNRERTFILSCLCNSQIAFNNGTQSYHEILEKLEGEMRHAAFSPMQSEIMNDLQIFKIRYDVN